jgi:DNA invertase Pin-like site-specific DNA recombinase
MSDINILEKRIKELEKENEELKLQLNKRKKVGRKQKLKEHEIETMKFYRFQGQTYKDIATLFDCSVGLVHKVLNKK